MTEPEDHALSAHLAPEERDPEAPDADAVEQATDVDPAWTEPTMSDSIEAPAWDAYEQSMVVQFEDDYR